MKLLEMQSECAVELSYDMTRMLHNLKTLFFTVVVYCKS